MRTRTAADHQDVVHRRLELLRAELAREWATSDPPAADGSDGVGSSEQSGEPWWAGHTVVPGASRHECSPAPTGSLTGQTVPPVSSASPPVPLPGRHAHRRRRPLALAMLVPEPLRGRVGVGPWHLAVIALGVAFALAATCWWVIRSDSSATPVTGSGASASAGSLGASASPLIALQAGPSASSVPAGAPSGSGAVVGSRGGAPASPTATVTVDVEGPVRRPGIAVLPAGSRIIDAIKAAGGARRRRDLTGLNLAAVLSDGQQVVVGEPQQGVTLPEEAASDSTASGTPTLVNLNTATAEELEQLPDVGPVTAQSIIDWREQNGGFASVDELLEVDGIGDKTLAKLTPYVTV